MKVSIHILTYNHEKFIAQALDGVLMQEVDFDYEMVIGEDCSTDRTRQIVMDYQQRYPDKIRALLHETNIGANRNDVLVHNACRGEYIAWLEGDDYWTSPDKLQKQVDFLDQHPDCSMCFHNTRQVYEDGSRPDYNSAPPVRKPFYELEDLFDYNFMPTCSIMVRRRLFATLPDYYEEVYSGDWLLQILGATYGRIGYIDELMAVTRIHKGGAWSGIDRIERWKHLISDCKIMKTHIAALNGVKINHIIADLYFKWAAKSAGQGDPRGARKPIIRSIIESPFHPEISNIDRIKLLIKVFTPGLNALINYLRDRSTASADPSGRQ